MMSKAIKRKSDPTSTEKSRKGKKLKTKPIENKYDNANLSDTEEYDPAKHDVISEYEMEREKNMKANMEMLLQLELTKAKTEFKQVSSNTPQRKIGLQMKRNSKLSAADTPRRASSRLQKLEPDSIPKPLPQSPIWQEKHLKPIGDIKMEAKNQVDENALANCLSSLCSNDINAKKETFDTAYQECGSNENTNKYHASYKMMLKSLVIREDHVAKVVPERIYSTTFHPSADRLIACVGDKEGHVGVWDVDSVDSPHNGIFLLDPHSRVVNWMEFSPSNNSRLFTCSYDGTIRCGDLNKQIFEDIYRVTDEGYERLNYCGFPAKTNEVLLVASSEGYVYQIDAREKKIAHKHNVQANYARDRSLRCISSHPLNEYLFATSGYNGLCAIWDVRNVEKHVDEIKSTKVCHGIAFSPVTGKKLVTISMDDTICIGTVESGGKVSSTLSIRHDNHTGRWLSPFRPVWDPKNEDFFLVGSMLKPRQLDIFSATGSQTIFHSLNHENFTTVGSRNSFHPARNCIVSCNSSGKVSIWTEP